MTSLKTSAWKANVFAARVKKYPYSSKISFVSIPSILLT